jgi:hypothetical protein
LIRARAFAGSLALVACITLLAPTAASAHIRTGLVAVDLRARILRIPLPLRAAATVRVYETDQALGLTARRGHVVVVSGYTGEPFLRLGAAGAAVNTSSPTAAAVGLLKHGRPAVGLGRGWVLESSRPAAVWHDARVRALAPGMRRREWTIPLVVDRHRVWLEGEITRVDAPSPWPWLALGIPFLGFVGLLLAGKRSLRRSTAVGTGVVSAAGTLVTAAAFALADTASAARWIEGANEFVFALAGLAVVARGSADARPLAGGALGLIALWAGLSKVPIFLHGVVLSALPASLTRALVALTVSAGAAAAAVGLVVFFELLEPRAEPSITNARLRRPS